MTDNTQLIQDAANMGVLARQAIGNEFPSMEVDPKICANVALLVERLMQTTDEAPAPEDARDPEDIDAGERLAHAKEEGRREAIGEFAQEKADWLQRITDLEASCENLTIRLVKAVDEIALGHPPLTTDAEGGPVAALPGEEPDQERLFSEGAVRTRESVEQLARDAARKLGIDEDKVVALVERARLDAEALVSTADAADGDTKFKGPGQ